MWAREQQSHSDQERVCPMGGGHTHVCTIPLMHTHAHTPTHIHTSHAHAHVYTHHTHMCAQGTCTHIHLDKVNIANLDELQNHDGRSDNGSHNRGLHFSRLWKVHTSEGEAQRKKPRYILHSWYKRTSQPHKLLLHRHSGGCNLKRQTVTRMWRNPSPVRYGWQWKMVQPLWKVAYSFLKSSTSNHHMTQKFHFYTIS